MRLFFRILGFGALLVIGAAQAYAADTPVVADDAAASAVATPAPAAPVVAPSATAPASAVAALPERSLGKKDAPIKVDEYVSLTCPHCGEFFNDTLPELEKRYVDTGKVRFVMHDYVMDGAGLKAASLAHCMPEDEFYPFVKLLYRNQMAWALSGDPEKLLISYAKLGGLPEDKAKACLADTKLQDALVNELNEATAKNIQSVPTFIINDGVDKITGNQPIDDYAKIFDRLLAAKH